MGIKQDCGSEKRAYSRVSAERQSYRFTPNSFCLQKKCCNMGCDSFHEVQLAIFLTAHRADTDVGKE